jgi:hypothetical protein
MYLIKKVENPTPAVVNSVESTRVDNSNIPDNMTSKVALEEPEIASTDPNQAAENN